MTAEPPILEVAGLGFAIEGHAILRDVGFEVRRGEYLAIVGPNGAGKSTLLKCLDRIYTAQSGEVRLLGRPLGDYRQRELARHVGYVPQADGRMLPFTVEEFVLLGRYPYLSPFTPVSREDRQAVREALDETGMLALRGRKIDTLSGGERQKVMIAAALAQGAELLLLDEATTFLDYRHEAEVRALLRRTHRQRGVSIVAVTHDVNAAAIESDRVLGLSQGRVIFHGTPAELMNARQLEEIYGTTLTLVDHPEAALPMIVPTAAGRPVLSNLEQKT